MLSTFQNIYRKYTACEKVKLAFCSLGVDQVLEQENKSLKVFGGLTLSHRTRIERLLSEADKMAEFSPKKQTTHHEMSNRVQDRQEVK
jgi:hypothetical protein